MILNIFQNKPLLIGLLVCAVALVVLIALLIIIKSRSKYNKKLKHEVLKNNNQTDNQIKEEQKQEQSIKKETNQKTLKVVEEQQNQNEKPKIEKYMITYNKEEKLWVVKKTGAKRASKKFKTKAEAVVYAQRISEEKGMALTVKKKDGKFQKASNI